MEELYAIMRELLEVEYNQKALLHMMELMEAAYGEEAQESPNLAVNGVRYYLAVLQKDLGITINRLDTYMAKSGTGR